jgi:hypothetical protein
MNLRFLRLKTCGVCLLLATLWLAVCTTAHTQPKQLYKFGEIVLYCQPGTAQERVTAIAGNSGAQVKQKLMTDCYLIALPNNRQTEADTFNAVAALRAENDVRWVGANTLLTRFQAATRVPNDPRFRSGEQWNLNLLNMPQAWALQRGSANVVLSIIDDGYDPNHEDMRGQFHPESFSPADGDANIGPDGLGFNFQHGHFAAGVMNAITNNGLGIAGVVWEGIKTVALKDQPRGGAATLATILQCYDRLFDIKTRRGVNVVACNMSYSTRLNGDPTDTNDPEYQAVKRLADAGVLMVAAAGNLGPASNATYLPQAYPFVITCGAVTRSGARASYSNPGKVEIMAPGGFRGDSGRPEDGVLSTLDGGYDTADGTSFSAPAATAVLGLMMSVPNMTPTRAWQTVRDTANRSQIRGTLPDREYGFGTIDAFRALQRVSVSALIVEPEGIDAQGNATDPGGVSPPIETLQPTIRINVAQVPLSKLTVRIEDGAQTVTIPQATLQNSVESGDARDTNPNPQYVLAIRYRFTTSGQKTIIVTGSNQDDTLTTTDRRVINITPKVIAGVPVVDNQGAARNIAMISVPYFETAADAQLPQPREVLDIFGTGVRFWRYRYFPAAGSGGPSVVGAYARFPFDPNAGTPDRSEFAKLRPPDAKVNVEGDTTTNYAPIGLAYFAEIPAPTEIRTFGRDLSRQVIRLELREGWNMVGCPYPFPVSFNSILIEMPSGQRLTALQAADQKVILPFLYRFVGGQYEFATLPAGSFRPWEGHWLYVIPQGGMVDPNRKITVIFNPTQSEPGGRNRSAMTLAANMPAVSGPGSWMLRLEAKTGSLRDSNNFVGVTSNAGNQVDSRSRAPKPPQPAPYIHLGVTRPEAADGGFYAQDIQPMGGAKTWNVMVMTDQKNADVTVSWPGVNNIPRNYRLSLTDKVTGQVINLRTQSSYQFNSGPNAGSRAFVLTARPATTGGRALINNIAITPRRTRGEQTLYEISYSLTQDARIEVSILGFGGQIIARVGGGTRSVESGDNVVVWNGLDSAGRPLAAGTYVVQFQVVTQEGDVTREVRPFLLTR